MNNLKSLSDVSTVSVSILWISSAPQAAGKPYSIETLLLFIYIFYPDLFIFFCPPLGFHYFVPSYGYPQQRNTAVLQPNNAQQNLDRTTQRPQLPLQVR